MIVCQDATGGRKVTCPSSFKHTFVVVPLKSARDAAEWVYDGTDFHAVALPPDERCTTFTIPETDLTAAAATEDETLFELQSGHKVSGVFVKHSAAFTGGTLSAMTVSIGDSSSTTFYTSAFDIFQAVGDMAFQDTDMYKSSSNAERNVLARFTATGDNVVNATAGSVDIRVA